MQLEYKKATGWKDGGGTMDANTAQKTPALAGIAWRLSIRYEQRFVYIKTHKSLTRSQHSHQMEAVDVPGIHRL